MMLTRPPALCCFASSAPFFISRIIALSAVQRYSASIAAAAAGYAEQVAALKQRISAANARASATQRAAPTKGYTTLAATQQFLAQSRANMMRS